jgi:hypothetical protein
MPKDDELTRLHRKHVIAVIWDFDKTLIPGYMQRPIFEHYGVDEDKFWKEVNALPALYAERGMRVTSESVYLNHLLSYVKNGPMKGLCNGDLQRMGQSLEFYPGLPAFLDELKAQVRSRPEYQKFDIQLEHYVISTGLAAMIRGSAIAESLDGIFGCEFVEGPMPPHYLEQNELPIDEAAEISQIGQIVDNTIKTRFIFEINKGSNRHSTIDVNAKMAVEDRRVPIPNMIYIADGPSDVPVFSVVRKGGGKTFAVYDPDSQGEFEQNDQLLLDGRVHAYGPADYTSTSQTHRWLKLQVSRLCERIVEEAERAMALRVKRPPRHIREDALLKPELPDPQSRLFD